jgi:hypothetical protein
MGRLSYLLAFFSLGFFGAASAVLQFGELALDEGASSLSADGATITLALTYSSWLFNLTTSVVIPEGTQFSSATGATFRLPANISITVGSPTINDVDRRGMHLVPVPPAICVPL